MLPTGYDYPWFGTKPQNRSISCVDNDLDSDFQYEKSRNAIAIEEIARPDSPRGMQIEDVSENSESIHQFQNTIDTNHIYKNFFD